MIDACPLPPFGAAPDTRMRLVDLYSDGGGGGSTYLFLLYFGPVSVSPQRAHNWVVKFQYQNRGHRETIIYPTNVFNFLRFTPFLNFLPVSSYRSTSSPFIPSSLSAAAAATALAPDRSRTSCYYHLLSTQPPGLCTVFLQRSRIRHVAMYCATILCLFKI